MYLQMEVAHVPMLDVLLSLEVLYLWPSCGGIISCHKNYYCECKIVAIATYANVQATLQGESLWVQAGLGRLLS